MSEKTRIDRLERVIKGQQGAILELQDIIGKMNDQHRRSLEMMDSLTDLVNDLQTRQEAIINVLKKISSNEKGQ